MSKVSPLSRGHGHGESSPVFVNVSESDTVAAELGVGKNPVKSVAEWLGRLGLTQYQGIFQENAIQLVDLDLLTADMLRDIGIKPLGHRLAMVRGAELMKAQEQHHRRNHLLLPVFRDYCECDCFAKTYKLTASSLTVTTPTCCRVAYDPVDITDFKEVDYYKGCCAGKVVIKTVDGTKSLIEMKLANAKVEEVAMIIINAMERDEGSGGGAQARAAAGGGGKVGR
jgi:hypothetical protein